MSGISVKKKVFEPKEQFQLQMLTQQVEEIQRYKLSRKFNNIL